MNHLNAKNSPTILMIVGLALGFLSFTPFVIQSHGLFQLVLVASSLAILAKATIELFRPSNEWWKIGIRTFVLMFFYALFMPAWAKLKLAGSVSPESHDLFGFVIICCLFANPVVTLLKLLQFFVQRQKS